MLKWLRHNRRQVVRIADPGSPSAAIDISAIALQSKQPQSVFTQLPTDDHMGRGAMIDWWRAMTLPPQQTPAGGKDAQFPRSRHHYSLLLEQNHSSRFPISRNPQFRGSYERNRQFNMAGLLETR
jgi:hypothetical protein